MTDMNPTYIVYDPTNGNKIRCWIQCPPELADQQMLRPNEIIVLWNGPPPILGRTEKIYNPTTEEITDGGTATGG
jgi:hypothetical protein